MSMFGTFVWPWGCLDVLDSDWGDFRRRRAVDISRFWFIAKYHCWCNKMIELNWPVRFFRPRSYLTDVTAAYNMYPRYKRKNCELMFFLLFGTHGFYRDTPWKTQHWDTVASYRFSTPFYSVWSPSFFSHIIKEVIKQGQPGGPHLPMMSAFFSSDTVYGSQIQVVISLWYRHLKFNTRHAVASNDERKL